MKKLPYRISEAGSRLYRAGVSYFQFGTLKHGREAIFDYFTCDGVSAEQLAMLREFCPDVQVAGGHAQYAPEIKRVNILFPKAAWYRAQSCAAIAKATGAA